MYKNCITQASAARQRELENQFLTFMLTHRYENISVSEFCDSTGIPRKAFYRYFSSKDGALFALIDHALLDFANMFFKDTCSLDKTTAVEFFRYWSGRRHLLKALEQSNMSGLLVQRCLSLLKVHNRYTEMFFPFIAPERRSYILIFFVSGLMSLLVQWESDHFQKSPEEMGEIAVHILTQSFLP